MKEFNIKQDMPPADIAVANVLTEIEYYKNTPEKVLKIIHGYGSHGVGGEIKKLLHIKLTELEKRAIIKGFVKGENFGKTNKLYDEIIKYAPEVLLQNDMNYNGGITLVLLK